MVATLALVVVRMLLADDTEKQTVKCKKHSILIIIEQYVILNAEFGKINLFYIRFVPTSILRLTITGDYEQTIYHLKAKRGG